jgi:outer membrane protein assembly factor BamB
MTRLLLLLAILLPTPPSGEDWPQSKFDGRRSGHAPGRRIETPLGLLAAIPMKDAVYGSPVVAGGLAYVVDGSGTATCVDARTLQVRWRTEAQAGKRNGDHVSSPAVVGGYLHFGMTTGKHRVLDAVKGTLVREVDCGSPIWSSPAVSEDRVYVATVGAEVTALRSDGTVCWTWDLVKEVMNFPGDRWNGDDWLRDRKARLGHRDRFLCTGDVAVRGKTVIFAAGNSVVWLNDLGTRAEVRALHRDDMTSLGMAVGEQGAVYQQGHLVDNGGSVRILDLNGEKAVLKGDVPGTTTGARLPSLMGFASVGLRGDEVFRTRPQAGFGLCRHGPGRKDPEVLSPDASVASPVILDNAVLYGDLLGNLHAVPLDGGKAWTFKTAFGKTISAPVAVADGRVYVGCEDGYLYILGPGGTAPLPTEDLGLHKIRSSLSSPLADARYDRFTSFGDFANTNATEQGVKPPFRMNWIRRYEGTTKHASTCGGGRLYTHTAEGQLFAVEQETGRMLWRTYFPGVHLSFTSPLYHRERLLVPQAGQEKCLLRCLDAATGRLLWEAPFSGTPGWTRQAPPVVHGNLAIYAFGTGRFGEGVKVSWLFSADGFAGYPSDYKPLVRAYDLDTGKVAWERDFSEHGSGGDEGGVCVLDGTLYYSCFFGRFPEKVRGNPGSSGITAAIEPATGRVAWINKEYATTGHCAISGAEGRLYLGGFNPQAGSRERLIVCLNAKDGSLLWKSDPIGGLGTTPVVTVGPRFLYAHSQNTMSFLLDKATGKILAQFAKSSRCTRFTLSDPYLFGANLDVFDLTDPGAPRLIGTGPRIDVSECNAAVVSNGRIFTTGQGGGIQVGQVYGREAAEFRPPWQR